MKIYMAPMEGLTGYIYRNAHAKYFGEMDKYFTPFISPTMHKKLSPKEQKDVLPEHNMGLHVVPQILTNNAEYFIAIAKDLLEYGYDEINLNLGCPSGTVVSKGKGSGFLDEQRDLDKFLDVIFTELDMKISIKTRLGTDTAEDHAKLSALFNKYPLEELIIHPRIQKDFYKNKPKLDIFEKMNQVSKNPICYNGDINTTKNYLDFKEQFSEVDTFMLGRGLMQNPNLANEIKAMEHGEKSNMKKDQLESFLNELFEGYQKAMREDRNALFRMKELWSYLIKEFPGCEYLEKKIKKSQKGPEYREIVKEILGTM